MNERIRELAEQAVYYDEDEESWEFDRKKFAELIIEECVVILNKRKDAAIDASWCVDEAMSNAVWDIEEYFKVEE
jgi:hypothetical protein